MDRERLLACFEQVPVVAAAKSAEGLERALHSESGVIFLLFGDILSIGEMVARVKAAGKIAIVHMDLIEGLAARDIGVDFLADRTRADGIISTTASLIRRAKQRGLVTIQRFFLLDSLVLENIEKQVNSGAADFLEVLPGLMPKIISHLSRTAGRPIIAGGLIRDKEDVVGALKAGAVAISSTNDAVWFM